MLPRWWLTFTLAGWVGLCCAVEPRAAAVDAEAQEKVAQILQGVIQEYWNGGGPESATGIRPPVNYVNVELAFREASKLMPDRLDLRLGLASALVSQGIKTNGRLLEMKVKAALQVYQEIQALDTNGFEASIWYAAYTRALGQTNTSAAAIRGLMAIHPQRTREYLQKFSLVDRLLQAVPHKRLPQSMPQDGHHAIVILGAGLETNGTVKAKLANRLDQGLKLARIYPNAPIILTGGNPRSGVTEASAMGLWLEERGISQKRLILEDQAKDTVENAMFSAALLQSLGVTHVTLVTSASHVRRGLADLQEAARQRGLELRYDHVAAKDKGAAVLNQEQERVRMYRDLMRTSGLWAFPGIHR